MGYLLIEMGVCLSMLLMMICVDSQSNERSLWIDGEHKIAETDSDFICATMDWWPPEKCDYGVCSWDHSSLLNVDLNNKIFKNAIKAFSPLKIRLGGTLQDDVIYQTQNHQEPCNPFIKNTSELFGFTKGCLPSSRWDELNTFFQETGAVVTFGLNVLMGKTVLANGSTVGAWDSTNAQTLMRYTVQKNYTIYGWELGNELSGNGIGASVSASQYAIDTMNLQTVVHRVYKDIEAKPLIIAPGGFFNPSWFKEFLAKTPETLNVISHHIYNLGAGVDQNLTEKILDPSYLDGVADTFKKLELTINTSASYASAWKGITVLLMNLDNSTSFDVKLSVNSTWRLHKHRSHTHRHHHHHRHHTTKHAHETKTGGKRIRIRTRQEYHLTAKDGNLHSQVMMLNGKELTINESGDIPSLEPLYTNSSEPITVAPYSIVFAHIPHFTLRACKR
ncbi:Glycoside hydrolase, catalytic domain-containing protein [Cynara cardunculus var. scolymus]|uniref:Glycoside hydrolase, catalytic domain-containing protein n=1 Tax=Cynara cardunculus var. scolymus TaxID=59895 RepID=A0A103Y110_CYNCS|nr:Glycoside hydrolase, catalytic domain-containing protein [Cynara cardunculus var. scolymus]